MAIVYQVLFKNGKRYIGISSNTLITRKSEHYSRVKSGSKLAIHNALRKHEEADWSILYSDIEYEDAKSKEIELIETLSTFAPNGYNLTKGGDGFVGMVFSDEYRQKLSKAQTGKKRYKEHIDAMKVGMTGCSHKDARVVVGICIATGKTTRYNSITLLEKEGCFDKVCVCRCANGKRKTHKGFTWSYIESDK